MKNETMVATKNTAVSNKVTRVTKLLLVKVGQKVFYNIWKKVSFLGSPVLCCLMRFLMKAGY